MARLKIRGRGRCNERTRQELKPLVWRKCWQRVFLFIVLSNVPFSLALASPQKRAIKPAPTVRVEALKEGIEPRVELEAISFKRLMTLHKSLVLAEPAKSLSNLNYFRYNRDDLSQEQFIELYFAIAQTQQRLNRVGAAIETLNEIYGLLLPETLDIEFELEQSLAQAYRAHGNYSLAVASGLRGLEIAKENEHDFQQVNFALLLANLYLDLDKLGEGKHYLSLAKSVTLSTQEKPLRLWFLTEQASWHQRAGELFLAQQSMKRAIGLSEQQGYGELLMQSQLKLAELYRIKLQFNQAEPLLQDMYREARRQHNRRAQFHILKEVVALKLAQQDYDEADKYWLPTSKLLRHVNVSGEEKQALTLAVKDQKLAILIGQEKFQQAWRWLASYQDSARLSVQDADGNEMRDWQTLSLLIQLQQSESAIKKLKTLMAKNEAKFQAQYLAKKQFEQALFEAQLLGLEQRISGLMTDKKLLAHQLHTTQFKSKWLVVLIVFLLNLVGIYYIWRQYGGMVRNQNLYLDPLTQLPNYRAMCETGYQGIASQSAFSLVVFDLDDFATINKRLGYRQADALLLKAVQGLNKLLHKRGVLYRYQGDSFVVFAPGFNKAQASTLAERLRIELKFVVAEIQSSYIELTATFAVVESEGSQTLQTLLDSADATLRQAKKAGKNRTV